MKPAALADIINAVPQLNRRQWISRTLALGSAATVSGLLSACGSGPKRSTGLVGRPIPQNPDRASDYTPTQPVTIAHTPQHHSNQGLTIPPGVVPRSQWARYGPNVRLADPMVRIQRITVHHDGMPPVRIATMAAAAARIELIRRGHRGKGWADIGYHYIVDPQGRVWEGRPITLQGAHVKNQNPHNLGILVLGNFEIQRPTASATSAVERFLVEQMHRYRVPLSKVYTHRELAATACPGRNLQRIMVAARSRGGTVANA
jgi:N-acetylmuramoyl-L-alanine amidase-like protein